MLKKTLIALLVAVVVFFLSQFLGFPRVFSWVFVGFVAVGFLFLLLLDAPRMPMPQRPMLSVIVGFVLMSAALFLGSAFMPQYNPSEEVGKVLRMQQNFTQQDLLAQKKALEERAAFLGIDLTALEAGGGQANANLSPEELIAKGKTVYQDFECYNCHKIGGQGGVKKRGPELDNVAGVLTADLVQQKLMDPTVFMAEGFEREYQKGVMPDTYADQMAPDAMDALVAYLMTLNDSSVNTPRPLDPQTGQPLQVQVAGGEGGGNHMPEGWWTDPDIIAKGKDIYEGKTNPEVNCSACHGRDGKPVLTGAADFRDPALVASLSDSEWYDKVANGVPGTAMTPWKDKLTPEQIWQVIAYQNTCHTGGQPEVHQNP